MTPQEIRNTVACRYCEAAKGAECRTAGGLRLRLPYSSRLTHYSREVDARRALKARIPLADVEALKS